MPSEQRSEGCRSKPGGYMGKSAPIPGTKAYISWHNTVASNTSTKWFRAHHLLVQCRCSLGGLFLHVVIQGFRLLPFAAQPSHASRHRHFI